MERSERLSRAEAMMVYCRDGWPSTPDMVATVARVAGNPGAFRNHYGTQRGGHIPPELVFRSVRLFAQEVAPQLR